MRRGAVPTPPAPSGQGGLCVILSRCSHVMWAGASGFYSPAPAALLLRGGRGRPPHRGGPSSPPYPHPPLPPKVEAPSSWSWLRGKQSQPSFSPFQSSSHLRQPLCPKWGAWKSSLGRGPRPPCLLLPPCRGAGRGARFWGEPCVTSCTKTFLKPLFRDFCPAGWGGSGCLPYQGSCCG